MEQNKSPLIIKLEIDDEDFDSGVDCISLVESPATEEDFYLFSKQKMETYNDYPQAASENAQRALNWAEKNGWGSCGTPVGKRRANQLANREPISEDTIARMAAFERHRRNSKTPYGEGCGKLMWDAWGGDEGIAWAQRKLEQIKQEKELAIEVGNLPNYINQISASAEVPIFDDINEAILYSMIIGCEGEIHTHKLDDGTTIYMPCATMEDAQSVIDVIEELKEEPKYISNLPADIQDKLMKKLEEVAQDEEELIADMKKKGFAMNSTSDLTSIMDYGKFRIRYVYTGPRDNKNRDFCRKLLDFQGGTNPMTAKKIFRKEDINQMTITGENDQFGIYDIFTYKGSYGCRHHWSEVRYSIDDQTGNIVKQIQQSINPATSVNAKPTANRNPNSPTLETTINQEGFSVQNKEKQIVAGPLMIPDKMIYRYDDFNGEYWVYFSKDTIERIAYKFMIQKNQDQSNLEHSDYFKLDNVSLVESWIIDNSEKDKSYTLTGKQYPVGTWFGVMKINDKSIWNEWVKTGKVKGFSVEGYFVDQIINASNQNFYYRTTKGGTDIVIDHKTLVVFILEDGERVAVMPDGTYELTNGETLVVKESKAVGSFSS